MNWFTQIQCCKTNQTNQLREITFSSINEQNIPFKSNDIIINDEYPDDSYVYKLSPKNEKIENYLRFQHRNHLFTDSINTSSFTNPIYDINSIDYSTKFGETFIKNGKMTIDPTHCIAQIKEKNCHLK